MSNKPLYQSERMFSIYGYAMSHGLLLLRSGKSNEFPKTRVDVLFSDVRVLEIRAWLKGIAIEEVQDPQFLSGQNSKPMEMVEPGIKVYALSSSNWRGFIVAGGVSFTEDEGEIRGPSSLVCEPPVKRWTLG
jgi:hypothetical protein